MHNTNNIILQGCLPRLSTVVNGLPGVLIVTLALCAELFLVMLALCLCVQHQGGAHKTLHTIIVRQQSDSRCTQPASGSGCTQLNSDMCTMSATDRSTRPGGARCRQIDEVNDDVG